MSSVISECRRSKWSDPQIQEVYRSAYVTVFPWWLRALRRVALFIDQCYCPLSRLT